MTSMGVDYMKRKLVLLAVGIILVSLSMMPTAYSQDFISANHEIVILTGDEKTNVKETITLQGGANEYVGLVDLWIQDGAGDINIFVKGSKIEPTYSGNLYTINLSSMGIEFTSQPSIEITYTLDKNIKNFQKDLLRNTSALKITFNDNLLYKGSNLATLSSFELLLYQPTETPLSIYLIVGILLVVILLAVVTSYMLRRQRTTKIKKFASESEELLATKKGLLMELLKELEKQHRANQISDDTYHKLKEQYKQETVEAMKHLEDMKSEVK
jgi:hypothetical protein